MKNAFHMDSAYHCFTLMISLVSVSPWVLSSRSEKKKGFLALDS